MIGRISIDRIKSVVAAEFDVSVAELVGVRRDLKFIRPRHIAIYLACILTPNSRSVIGRLFGARDHSTIYHAQWKIARCRAVDREFDQRILSIIGKLDPQPIQQPEIQLALFLGPLFDRSFGQTERELELAA
jgi:chromosomal replication initiator protein